MTAFVVFVITFFVVYRIAKAISDERLEKKAGPIIEASIATHGRTLYIKREQLKTADPYGNVEYSRFAEHVGYFMKRVIQRDLDEVGLGKQYLSSHKRAHRVYNLIVRAVSAEAEKANRADIGWVKTGLDYETFCKGLLEDAGWEVETTPGSGDQGADLIAKKPGVRVVLQCKYYGQPVGNKAVQEAYAAKAHQKAGFAAVVTNAAYTSSAQQLGQTSGVFLIHHHQLATLESVIGQECQTSDVVGALAQ